MGISFRKRIGTGNAGRINVSKGGVGGSVGNKAGRLGVSSAGTPYVRGGTNGVYYRSEASNSLGEPRSSSPGSGSTPSQSSSDVTVISANMPMDELIMEHDRMMRKLTSEINQMSFRMNKGPVIEEYQQRYLSAIVNGAFNGGRRRGSFSDSERAWKDLANKYNEKGSFLAPLQAVGQRQKQLASLTSVRNFEPYRADFESLARDESTCIQAVRAWCEEFDQQWNRVAELGWLPRLGRP